MENRALGKGISALIPEVEREEPTGERVANIEVARVFASKYQPREIFKKDRLDELVNSIREKGVVQPILVRETPENRFELIAGERRLRAVKELGLEKIPAIIRRVDSNVNLFELSLIENIQREGLNAIEEAHAYQRLMEEFKFDLDGIGKAVGKDKTSVSNTMRLLKLPAKIQEYISSEEISMGHGKALLSLDNQREQLKICSKIIKTGLSVRETERLVSKRLAGPTGNQAQQDQDVAALEEELRRALGTRVKILHAGKKGRIQIDYFSLDELDRLLSVLRKAAV
ncbi:MAG: ParB/RepB/Spo0J family partition protein [Candidatus Omnitrophota bacterium]